MAYESRNPFSDELIGKFELISDSELALALEAPNNTFRLWQGVIRSWYDGIPQY